MASYDLFLAFASASRRLDVIREGLAVLQPHVNASCVQSCDAHYRAATDTALLALKLDVRVISGSFLDRIRIAVERCDGALLDSSALPEAERNALYDSHLKLYEVALCGFPGLDEALRILGRRLGLASPVVRTRVTRPGGLKVRYRRGELWMTARARGLTRDGVYLSTGAPPRLGDPVELRFESDCQAISLNGVVVHVTQRHAANALGAGGFSVRFRPIDVSERQHIDSLMMLAHGSDLLSPAPPPRRCEARFPIELPVIVETAHARGGRREHLATDISRHGLFIAAEDALPPASSEVALMLPGDAAGGVQAIQAAARVVREISLAEAHRTNGRAGFGLEMVAFAAQDQRPFLELVERVEQRVTRNVLVGAGEGRLEALMATLVAVGYGVAGTSDARQLVTSAVAPQPPDLVVLDHSLAKFGAVNRALVGRSVSMLEVTDESPVFCRNLIDRRLLATASG